MIKNEILHYATKNHQAALNMTIANRDKIKKSILNDMGVIFVDLRNIGFKISKFMDTSDAYTAVEHLLDQSKET